MSETREISPLRRELLSKGNFALLWIRPMQNLQYPIFITVAEAMKLLRLGKTTIFAKIKEGDLTVAKFGRSTRITFSSVIRFAELNLREGSGHSAFAENLVPSQLPKLIDIAEQFAWLLCNTHCEPIVVQEAMELPAIPDQSACVEGPCTEKNFKGEI